MVSFFIPVIFLQYNLTVVKLRLTANTSTSAQSKRPYIDQKASIFYIAEIYSEYVSLVTNQCFIYIFWLASASFSFTLLLILSSQLIPH